MDNKKRTSCALILIAALSCSPALAQSALTAPAGGTSSGAGQEGIKVHGDWTLTMRNPDGSIAAHHEFKNALAIGLGGDTILAKLLSGTAVAGQWSVFLFTSPVSGCTAGIPCSITESSSTNNANSKDLTRSIPTSGPDAGKLVLRGSVRITTAATIQVVQTELTSCAASVAPASCVSPIGVGFTQRALSTGIPVAQDQLVEIKVVISFS